jgi:hypothetical protein
MQAHPPKPMSAHVANMSRTPLTITTTTDQEEETDA